MNEESKAVNLIAADGSVVAGEFTIRPLDPGGLDRVALALTLPDRRFEAAAVDCFEALILIRLELEPLGLALLCWGASLHVYPSEASRVQEIGAEAYRLTLGRFPTTADRVNLFDAGPGLVAASVVEQEEFSRAWFDSLADAG